MASIYTLKKASDSSKKKGKQKSAAFKYATKVTDGLNKLSERIKLALVEESKVNDDW
tara:strand:- start:16 stop:186 length:171 start_codon:yes stop_codon:yes gene_type:complete